MPTSTIRGADLSWSSLGDGPPVVYAHGLTRSRRTDASLLDWSPMARAGYRFISYDARGHGESTGDTEPSHYEWSFLADDLLGLLNVIAPDDAVVGLGCSMGTGTVLHAVIKEPDRFTSLILTAPPTAWSSRPLQAQAYRAGADFAEDKGVPALVEVLRSAPRAPIFQDRIEDPAPDISDALLPTVLRGAAMSDLPDLELLAAIHVPVLLLPWADDPGHPVSTAEALQRTIQGSVMRTATSLTDIAGWGDDVVKFLRTTSHD